MRRRIGGIAQGNLKDFRGHPPHRGLLIPDLSASAIARAPCWVPRCLSVVEKTFQCPVAAAESRPQTFAVDSSIRAHTHAVALRLKGRSHGVAGELRSNGMQKPRTPVRGTVQRRRRSCEATACVPAMNERNNPDQRSAHEHSANPHVEWGDG